MTDYHTIRVERDAGVATIVMLDSKSSTGGGAQSAHTEIGGALGDLRFDNDIRVVVIKSDAEHFYSPPPNRPRMANRVPGDDWDLTQGLHRAYQNVIEIEKPVIAQVHGQAAGFGASLIFACDFIVAAEDAVLGDSHIGMGEGDHFPLGRPDSGTAPGDGGNVFVPFYLTPPLAREYLWLAKQFTGAELHRMGCFNSAVPKDQLEAEVKRYCDALLKRPAYALALSKRAFNKILAERFNLSFDLSWSYEALNFYQYDRYKDGRGETKL